VNRPAADGGHRRRWGWVWGAALLALGLNLAAQPVIVTNRMGMAFVKLSPGTFQMGPSGKAQVAHPVTISRSFYLQTTEVTQGQWKAVMGAAPWDWDPMVKKGDDFPAVDVTWKDAQAFLKKLNARHDGSYRLPTEAEWEYACRAGTNTVYSFGDDVERLGDFAWFEKNAWNIGEKWAHQVGTKQPNPWGLFDMHGNVWEFCQDWYSDQDPTGPQTDPVGPPTGSFRVERGGSVWEDAPDSASRFRSGHAPNLRFPNVGFRLAATTLPKVAMPPVKGTDQVCKMALAKLGMNKKLKVERKGVMEPFLGEDASLVDPPEIIEGFVPTGAVALVRQEVAMGAGSTFTSAELILCEGKKFRSLYQVGGESRFGGTIVYEDGMVIARTFMWTDNDPNCCPSFAEDRMLTFLGGRVVVGPATKRSLPKP
jgi:formylglycine-generating enzyme required for sulfatase activity